jgi:ankyrin repeat protein
MKPDAKTPKRRATAVALAVMATFAICAGLEAQEIFEAARAGDLAKVTSSIDKDPGLVKAVDETGRTPLHWACRGVHFEVVMALVERGADVNARDAAAVTPLHSVASRGHLEAVKYLLARGARVEAAMSGGSTPLHLAAAKGYRDLAAILLDRNAPIDIQDDTEDTPLLAAAGAEKWDIVDLIAGRTPAGRADGLNRPDFDGNTALHLASGGGRLDTVALLLAKGAAIDRRNAVGQTAYNLADEGGFKDITACLAEKGADLRPQMFPRLAGPYLGQAPPGKTPRLFAKGIVSTKAGLYGTIVFPPDGREAFWDSDKMLYAKIENGLWGAPRAFPFTAKETIHFPSYSLDGRRLLFIAGSHSPQGIDTKEEIWFVERAGADWSEPKPFDAVINSSSMHWQFSMDKSGDVYLNSKGGICLARFEAGHYLVPEPLPAPVNVPHTEEEKYRVGEVGPFISPAGDYLIFAKFDRGARLLVSFRTGGGGWTEPRDLSDLLQTEGNDSAARVSPDGRYLFFQSQRKGSGASRGLYWVEAGVIDELRPKGTK